MPKRKRKDQKQQRRPQTVEGQVIRKETEPPIPAESQAERFAQAWEETLQKIADGESMREICASLAVHPYAARRWIIADPRRMYEYNAAYTFQADTRADQVDELAKRLTDEGKDMSNQEVQAIRTAIDAHKWSAAVKNARKYADRKTIDLPNAQTPEQAKEELKQLHEQFGDAVDLIKGKAIH